MSDEVTQEMINTQITFLSKSETDDVIWSGTVLGLVTYELARRTGDVVSYRAAVAQIDELIPAVEDLHYFLIKLDDVEGTPVKVFADEFISPGSLEALDERAKVTIELWDLATNVHTDIIAVLRLHGYRNVRITNIET